MQKAAAWGRQNERIWMVVAWILQSRSPRKKICMRAVVWLGWPRTVWLQPWPGVTFLSNRHFACIGLVCEMSLHVRLSSLTYISSPKNNTPRTKGCVNEHLNTLKSALESHGKFRNFFPSCIPFSYEKALFLYGQISCYLQILCQFSAPHWLPHPQNFHHFY